MKRLDSGTVDGIKTALENLRESGLHIYSLWILTGLGQNYGVLNALCYRLVGP